MSKLKLVNYEYVERRSGDLAKLNVSNENVKTILGWTPKYTLKDIIETDMAFRDKISKNINQQK